MKTEKVKILVVDDEDSILFALKELFSKEGYETILSKNGFEGLKKLRSLEPNIIFLDITMPMFNGLETLQEIKKHNPLLPVVIITGYSTMQTAIKAMQYGAFEYMTKPLDVERIRDVTLRALLSIESNAVQIENHVSYSTNFSNRYELIGSSRVMLEIYKLIGSISTTPNRTSVLILGESGTGKELVARAIHRNSTKSQELFIGINCTVLPETLLESELFGYEKGAFTGANERKLGKFEVAKNGTIFLDEIGNLTPNLQQKLLRVLQEREFERLGNNTPIPVNARFVAATNKDLESEVRKLQFREDLFYRLNVVTIVLPSLREHKEDIPLLANYILSKYNEQLKKSIRGFSDKSMMYLKAYSYPGNVRELENLIERAVMLTKGEVILPEALWEVTKEKIPMQSQLPIVSPQFSKSREYILGIFEKQYVTEQLSKFHGNVTTAAKHSDMTRQNFQRLMKKHKIEGNQFRN